MTGKEGKEAIEAIKDKIQEEMKNIMTNDIPFMRNHNFKLQEEALKYKYDGLSKARDIVWNIMDKYGIY